MIFVLLLTNAFRILALSIVASNLGFVPINKIKSACSTPFIPPQSGDGTVSGGTTVCDGDPPV